MLGLRSRDDEHLLEHFLERLTVLGERLEQLEGLTVLELAALLRLAERPAKRLAETEQLEGYPDPLAGQEKEALAYEEDMVRQSVDYARQVLGSASLDLGL